jgi:hypothetical protein
MKPPRARILIILAGLLLAAALPGSAAPGAAPSGPTIQERLDALLKHRIKPEPLPVDLPNPFLVFSGGIRESGAENASSRLAAGKETGAGTAGSDATAPAALAPPTTTEILSDCTARLKIGGIIIVNGQAQISINGILRKEGDLIAVEWNHTTIPVRLVRFVSGQVVFRYRDAEMTVKF